jgi:hypothetical protein
MAASSVEPKMKTALTGLVTFTNASGKSCVLHMVPVFSFASAKVGVNLPDFFRQSVLASFFKVSKTKVLPDLPMLAMITHGLLFGHKASSIQYFSITTSVTQLVWLWPDWL